MDKEQMKALIKEALLEMLAEHMLSDRLCASYNISPFARQNMAAASAGRADDLGQLMDRAEIFRLLD